MHSQPERAASSTICLATARSPPWLIPISAITNGFSLGPIFRCPICMCRSGETCRNLDRSSGKVKSKPLLSGLLAGICLCFVRIISNEFLTHAAEDEVCPDQDPTFGVRDMRAELKFHQVLWLVPNVTQGDHRQLVPPFAHPRQ